MSGLIPDGELCYTCRTVQLSHDDRNLIAFALGCYVGSLSRDGVERETFRGALRAVETVMHRLFPNPNRKETPR